MRRFSRDALREVDRRATEDLGIPALLLMENAGAGAAAIAAEMLENQGFQGDKGTVVCVAGRGGNGGDALVAARHLAVRGFRVRILLFGPAKSPDPAPSVALHTAICGRLGLRAKRVASERDVAAARRSLARAALVVDGLFGSGLSRPVGGLAGSLIAEINASARSVIALDVPSGLDCDTGEPLGACVRADVTATFVGPKLGFASPVSRRWTGRVRVVGIGAPAVVRLRRRRADAP